MVLDFVGWLVERDGHHAGEDGVGGDADDRDQHRDREVHCLVRSLVGWKLGGVGFGLR